MSVVIQPGSKLLSKRVFVALTLAFIIAVVVSSRVGAQAVTFNSARNCDSNAVINCGAMSVSELQSKYLKDSSIVAIYEYFGVNAQAVKDMSTTAVAGSVTKSGNVVVNGKVVATNGVTAGRQNQTGSTAVNFRNVTFYKRTPAVSFQQDALDAFVAMNNGRFSFAVIASCGNVVSATAVATPTPTPTPKPTPTPTAHTTPTPKPTPKPKPSPTPSSTPSPSPTPTPVLAAPTTLINSGPGNAIGVFAGVSTAAGVGHFWVVRRRAMRG